MRELLILHPNLADLFLKGTTGFRRAAERRQIPLRDVVAKRVHAFQGACIRHLSIGDDPDEFEDVGQMIETMLENPGARRCLERAETDWRPE